MTTNQYNDYSLQPKEKKAKPNVKYVETYDGLMDKLERVLATKKKMKIGEERALKANDTGKAKAFREMWEKSKQEVKRTSKLLKNFYR